MLSRHVQQHATATWWCRERWPCATPRQFGLPDRSWPTGGENEVSTKVGRSTFESKRGGPKHQGEHQVQCKQSKVDHNRERSRAEVRPGESESAQMMRFSVDCAAHDQGRKDFARKRMAREVGGRTDGSEELCDRKQAARCGRSKGVGPASASWLRAEESGGWPRRAFESDLLAPRACRSLLFTGWKQDVILCNGPESAASSALLLVSRRSEPHTNYKPSLAILLHECEGRTKLTVRLPAVLSRCPSPLMIPPDFGAQLASQIACEFAATVGRGKCPAV